MVSEGVLGISSTTYVLTRRVLLIGSRLVGPRVLQRQSARSSPAMLRAGVSTMTSGPREMFQAASDSSKLKVLLTCTCDVLVLSSSNIYVASWFEIGIFVTY